MSISRQNSITASSCGPNSQSKHILKSNSPSHSPNQNTSLADGITPSTNRGRKWTNPFKNKVDCVNSSGIPDIAVSTPLSYNSELPHSLSSHSNDGKITDKIVASNVDQQMYRLGKSNTNDDFRGSGVVAESESDNDQLIIAIPSIKSRRRDTKVTPCYTTARKESAEAVAIKDGLCETPLDDQSSLTPQSARSSAMTTISSAKTTFSPFESSINDNEIPARDIALCLIDSELFRRIHRSELLSLRWSGNEKMEHAPNIVQMTNFFNDVTGWVANEVLKAESPKTRIRKIMNFISVAKECVELGDFNGFYSVLGGLKCTPVRRLERTWAMVDRKENVIFDMLSELMSPENNNDLYRKRLGGVRKPCVPYLDITFLHIALKKESSENKTQPVIDRKITIGALLEEFELFQRQCTYNFDSNSFVGEQIRSVKFDQKVENEHYTISYALEPKALKPTTPKPEVQNHTRAESSGKWEFGFHLPLSKPKKQVTNNSSPVSPEASMQLHLNQNDSTEFDAKVADNLQKKHIFKKESSSVMHQFSSIFQFDDKDKSSESEGSHKRNKSSVYDFSETPRIDETSNSLLVKIRRQRGTSLSSQKDKLESETSASTTTQSDAKVGIPNSTSKSQISATVYEKSQVERKGSKTQFSFVDKKSERKGSIKRSPSGNPPEEFLHLEISRTREGDTESMSSGEIDFDDVRADSQSSSTQSDKDKPQGFMHKKWIEKVDMHSAVKSDQHWKKRWFELDGCVLIATKLKKKSKDIDPALSRATRKTSKEQLSFRPVSNSKASEQTKSQNLAGSAVSLKATDDTAASIESTISKDQSSSPTDDTSDTNINKKLSKKNKMMTSWDNLKSTKSGGSDSRRETKKEYYLVTNVINLHKFRKYVFLVDCKDGKGGITSFLLRAPNEQEFDVWITSLRT